MLPERISRGETPLKTLRPSQPEEMNAEWRFQIGSLLTIHASARCTPSGVVAAGIAASAVLLAISVLVRRRRS